MSALYGNRWIIRDGSEQDVARCSLLDHTYETDHVMQLQVRPEDPAGWTITLKRERLPRRLEVAYPQSEPRLATLQRSHQCFLVAESRDGHSVDGYLAMQHDHLHRLGIIHDIVVTTRWRRHGIASKLLGAALTWAREHHLQRLMLEVQSKNVPSIEFCQRVGFVFCGFNDRYFANQDVALFFSMTVR
jgi:ribosomal protein S18 acetylase RimI-like enzyme